VPGGVGEEQRKTAGYPLPSGDARQAPSEWTLVCEGNLTPLHQVLSLLGGYVVRVLTGSVGPSSPAGCTRLHLVLIRSDLYPCKKLGTRCNETFQTHVTGLSEMSRHCAVPQCKQYSLCTSTQCTVLSCQHCSSVVHLRLLAGGTLIRQTLAL